MAKYNRADVVQGGNFELPRNRYRVRIVGTSFGKSSGGHDMTTLKCEIIEPEFIMVDGKEAPIAGRKFSAWLMHVPDEPWGQSRVFEFCDKLGVDVGDDYDTGLHKEYFHGMEFDWILSSKEDIKRQERKPGQKVGDPILDGEGKEISNGWSVTAQLDDVPAKCNPVKNPDIAEQPY